MSGEGETSRQVRQSSAESGPGVRAWLDALGGWTGLGRGLFLLLAGFLWLVPFFTVGWTNRPWRLFPDWWGFQHAAAGLFAERTTVWWDHHLEGVLADGSCLEWPEAGAAGDADSAVPCRGSGQGGGRLAQERRCPLEPGSGSVSDGAGGLVAAPPAAMGVERPAAPRLGV